MRKPAKQTPIERIFRKVLHRKMTAAERRVFFHERKTKLKAA